MDLNLEGLEFGFGLGLGRGLGLELRLRLRLRMRTRLSEVLNVNVDANTIPVIYLFLSSLGAPGLRGGQYNKISYTFVYVFVVIAY